MSEVDRLIMWVQEMREKYGVDGEKVFENAAVINMSKTSTGEVITCSVIEIK